MIFECALPNGSRCQQLLFQFLLVFVLSILPSATAVPRVAEAGSALQACSEGEKVAHFYCWENGTEQHCSALCSREHFKWNKSCNPVKTVPKHFSDWVSISSRLTWVACGMSSLALATLGRRISEGFLSQNLWGLVGEGTDGQISNDV